MRSAFLAAALSGVLLSVLASTAFPDSPTGGAIVEVTHESAALGREQTFSIYVPPEAEDGERFPVLYVLHGAYGGHRDWPTAGRAGELAAHYRMVLVFPDGGEFGWYVDSPHDPSSQYATYVGEELPAYIDVHYPTIADRGARGIMGLSMGGHGALLLAAKHPDRFGSASSLSGILKITDHPEKHQIAARLGPMEDNPELWAENSVWDQAERFRDSGVRLLFDCGEDDVATGAIGDSRKLHERLNALGIPHIWREHAGTHSWDYWSGHLREHLNFHQASMITADEGADRWFRLYFERMSAFLEENGRLALERPAAPTVALLGSSSLQSFPDELFPGYRVFNRAIAGDGLGIVRRGLSWRLEESVFDIRPDVLVIKNGRNDLGELHREGEPSIERMLEEYAAIVDEVRHRLPQTRIVVMTAFPVSGRFAHLGDSILEYNKGLTRLSGERGLAVVDAWPELAGPGGEIRPEYTMDGLHLTPVARDKVAALLLGALGGAEASENQEEMNP